VLKKPGRNRVGRVNKRHPGLRINERQAGDSASVHMRIASGKVVDGHVELDTDLPEGTSVIVLAPEGDETFEADVETETMLLEAIAQCERGLTTPLSDLLAAPQPRVRRYS